MSKDLRHKAYRLLDATISMADRLGYPTAGALRGVEIHDAGYVEPGYDGEIVATGDWNPVTVYDPDTKSRVEVSDLPCRLEKALEKAGVSIEWSDEWASCEECSRLVRTQPDGWDWRPSYRYVEGEGLYCVGCIAADEAADEDEDEDAEEVTHDPS